METKFTVDYFIKKFEAIPEELWCEGELYKGGARCATGHCGVARYANPTDEALTLNDLFKNELKLKASFKCDANYDIIMDINDGNLPRYQQPTPKQRILAALRDIKAMQQKEQPAPEPQYRFIEKHESIKPLLEKTIQLS